MVGRADSLHSCKINLYVWSSPVGPSGLRRGNVSYERTVPRRFEKSIKAGGKRFVEGVSLKTPLFFDKPVPEPWTVQPGYKERGFDRY